MPKILVVEDNPVEIETIKARLKQKQYEVLIAKNGEDGIQLARKEQPDLIFMDLHLPKINGVEICRRIKKDEQLKNSAVIW